MLSKHKNRMEMGMKDKWFVFFIDLVEFDVSDDRNTSYLLLEVTK